MKRMKKWMALVLAGAMVLSMAGCGGKDSNKTKKKEESKKPITIATKPTAEQYILGEMLSELIKDQLGYKTKVVKGLGATQVIQPALEKGEVDLYAEYTGSGWATVLKKKPLGVSTKDMLKGLQQEYEKNWKLTWLGLYGFNNTFAIVVPKEVAKEYQLKTISDLAKVADKLTFAGNPTYLEREDAFPTLTKMYGLTFKKIVEVDISLRYKALENKEADVTVAFTTDAKLHEGNVVVLEDDRHAMASYYCSTVVREDTLKAYKGLKETLMKMDGILSDEEMSRLNYQVEVKGKDEKQVAHDYLKEKGLLKK